MSHFRVNAEERRDIQEALVKQGMLGEVESGWWKARRQQKKERGREVG